VSTGPRTAIVPWRGYRPYARSPLAAGAHEETVQSRWADSAGGKFLSSQSGWLHVLNLFAQ
jgi:hypothetical protein